MQKLYTSLLFLFYLSLQSSQACDYCLLSQGISPLETARGIGLRADVRYTRLAELFHEGVKTTNHDNQIETHWTLQLTGYYTIHPRLTFLAVVPFVRRFETSDEADHHPDEHAEELGNPWGVYDSPDFSTSSGRKDINKILHAGLGGSGSTSGLGDITLLARYQLFFRHYYKSTFIIAAQAGIKIPTGDTNVKNRQGEFLDIHIQRGSGAFNYLAGLSLSYAMNRISFTANGLFSLTTEGTVAEQTYQYGNSLNYDASLRFKVWEPANASTTLFAAFGFSGEYHGKEKLGGIRLSNTGGNVLYLTPGFQIYHQKWILEFSFWQPIVHDLNGLQLGETLKSMVGINYLFR